METISTKIYTTGGKDAGSVNLPASIWGLPWNADLVHQVVVGMQSNARAATANTKTRGEVSGTGKKPWRQKGTGRARHGSMRSPIWVGGGISHGPRADKNYDKKINKKMRTKALFTALSQKVRDGQILFADTLNLSAIKTKDAQAALNGFAKVSGFETLNTAKANNILVVVPKKDDMLAKSFRNIFHTTLEDVRNLNVVDVMNYRYLVVASPEAASEILSAKMGDKKATSEKAPKKTVAKKVAKKSAAKAK